MNYKDNPSDDNHAIGTIDKKFDRSVSLLSWAYNEEGSILNFLERATKLMDATVENYEIILIDDGSTDKTYEIAKKFQEKNSQLKIFRNNKNRDVGICQQRAFKAATKEFLFWQTVDWSYDISNLRLFLEYLREYDIVLGARRSAIQVKSRVLKVLVLLFELFNKEYLIRRSDTVSKSIISIFHYLLVRTLFNVPVSDFHNSTFYPTKWVQSIKHEAKSPFVAPETLIKSYWNNMSIKEVSVSFIPRKVGESKGTRPKAILSVMKDIFRLWFRWIILGKRSATKKGKVYRLTNS
jgi:glycosyltransferase involved in cell wall biosynthesis